MAHNTLAQTPQPNALAGDGLPSGLVEAIIFQESRGDPNAMSGKGAGGLMGVMPEVWDKPGYGVAPGERGKRMDPQANVVFGTQLLKAYYNRYQGDLTKALMAYNWGPGHVNNWSGDWNDVPEETRKYVSQVTERILGDRETYKGEMYRPPVLAPTDSPIPQPRGALAAYGV